MSSPSITHASPSLKSSTSAVLSRKLMQRCTKLVENFYKEPPDDGCVGSFIETPVASIFPLLLKAKAKVTILK